MFLYMFLNFLMNVLYFSAYKSFTFLFRLIPKYFIYLFIDVMVSFAVQKLVSLIRHHLFIFAFIAIALGD